MSTTALYLRAAPGISTTRLLRTSARSSFAAIARCDLFSQSKGKSSATFANRGRQDGSHTPTVSPSPKIFARPFHASAVCRPSCDWGSPCDSDECRADTQERNPICEICKVNPTVNTFGEMYKNRKGISGYRFISYCQECVEKGWEAEAKIAAAHQEIVAAHQKIAGSQQDKVNKMLEHVKSLPPGEQVPIAYALDKISSIWRSGTSVARRHRALRQILSEELQIVKVGKRWKCDKGRVDAMDFDLWRSRSSTPRSKQYPHALTMWPDD